MFIMGTNWAHEGPLARRYREMKEREQPACALCGDACRQEDLWMCTVHPAARAPRWQSLCPTCAGRVKGILANRLGALHDAT